MIKYDLIVIGTGSGGSTAAYKCRKAGLTVAVIDKMPYGGTCALRGCDPKKVLVGATEVIDRIGRMKGLGINEGSLVDWKELMRFKDTFTESVPENREEGYISAGIDTYHGVASFINENKILVNDVKISFNYLLLAVGAKPVPLNLEGEEFVFYSDDFLQLDDLPKRIVFIGGGFISFEFAHIAALSGSEVHIIHRSETPLKHFDQELVKLLIKRSEELGITIHLNTAPISIEKINNHYLIQIKKHGENRTIECDGVFHGAGRIPNVDDLNLDKGKVTTNKKGIVVNEFLQSISNANVYATGDGAASDGLSLTPVAGKESAAAAENILNGNNKKIDYSVMPSVVFTQPKLAMVGLTEERALDEGYDITVKRVDTKNWYTYKRTNEPYAMTKTIIDKKTEKLLGVHIIGNNADDLINYFALIMKFDLPYKEVKNMIFAYPTSASDLLYLL